MACDGLWEGRAWVETGKGADRAGQGVAAAQVWRGGAAQRAITQTSSMGQRKHEKG